MGDGDRGGLGARGEKEKGGNNLSLMIFVFFFQAEDGIRDWSVTGVQTCALPIYITFLD